MMRHVSVDCSGNILDNKNRLMYVSFNYNSNGESRPTKVSGLVDALLTGVEVLYRDDDGSNKNACVGVSQCVYTCGSVGECHDNE